MFKNIIIIALMFEVCILLMASAAANEDKRNCQDKHDAMRQAIEIIIDGYELGPPMPMQQKPIMVSDLGE